MIPAVVDALAKISWVPKQNFSLEMACRHPWFVARLTPRPNALLIAQFQRIAPTWLLLEGL